MPILLIFTAGCDGGAGSPSTVDYDLGYQHGCDDGYVDANACEEHDDVPGLPDTNYAQGYEDGYRDCYETWSVMLDTTC